MSATLDGRGIRGVQVVRPLPLSFVSVLYQPSEYALVQGTHA
jgi:hypothetical protein